MDDFFARARVQHSSFILALSRYVWLGKLDRRRILSSLDRCDLKPWLDRLGADELASNEAVNQLKSAHDRLHGGCEKLMAAGNRLAPDVLDESVSAINELAERVVCLLFEVEQRVRGFHHPAVVPWRPEPSSE